jgi:hypothetical protein
VLLPNFTFLAAQDFKVLLPTSIYFLHYKLI